MKNSLNYLKLWQKKRDELPVNDSAQADWLQMQGLLNTHLPSSTPNSNISKAGKASKVSKIVKAIKGFKALAILVSATATIGTGVLIYNRVHKTDQNQTNKQQKKQIKITVADSLKRADSLLNDIERLNADSLSSAGFISDSIRSSNQHRADSGINSATAGSGSKAGSSVNNAIQTSNANAGSGILAANKNNYVNNGRQPGGNGHHNAPGKNGSSTSGKHLFTANSKSGQNNFASQSTVNQIPPQQGSNYQPLVLNTNNYRYAYLIQSVDSIQADVNGYFNQRAISNILYPGITQNSGTVRQNQANIKSIAGKIGKPVAGVSKTNQKDKNAKTAKTKLSSPLDLDWGLLMGINSSGSFTPKKQNSNFYGSLPVDIYFGLYGTYHFNEKWAVNLQAKALSPQNISGSYSHANGAKADSGAIDSGKTIRVSDSRKAYFVSVPIHLVYKLNNYLSLKAGPVINIPVKQITGTTSFTPLAIKTDTPYYTSVNNQLKNTRYVPAINVGVSAGVSLQYNRLSFEATYLKSISGFKVSSDFGSYKSNPGTLQLTIGFQLNKPKNK